ncbi:cystathionine beta-lyase [Geomicrobium sp. JCM 19037]|uniref:MalY/PatB family protein n=1 Tax=Geomicrobium sp. JCM 19037 TaxID=1460634 RepID=UPI00045F411A|nr:MalY/PatB family protein [Geomicrobium sp. JCM 19037]GAK05349.1 cystathionine beta-lyase [Geomicrobium sp. JCM 19037]
MNFDEIIERNQTNSMKWDAVKTIYKSDDVWPMWVADMDFKAPQPVLDALHNVTEHGVFGYHLPPESLREAISEWMLKRFDWQVETKQITFTPGVVPAIHHLIQALTNEGDKVIIQPPVYYPFFSLVNVNKRELLENFLLEDSGSYQMDMDDLETHMKNGAKMLILCNPHNPSGRMWKHDELVKLLELCKKYNVTLVSDEIHSDVILHGKHVPLASIAGAEDVQVATCMAPSKTFNLAALQLSYVISNDDELQRKLELQMKKTFSGIGSPFASAAAEAAYREGEPWLEDMLAYVQSNVDYVKQRLDEQMPKIRYMDPESTYLLWLDFRALNFEEKDLEQWLRQDARLALNDGHTFGKPGSGFARMNLGCPRSHVKEGLDRLQKAYEQLV